MGVVAGRGKMTNNFHYYNVPLKTHKKNNTYAKYEESYNLKFIFFLRDHHVFLCYFHFM